MFARVLPDIRVRHTRRVSLIATALLALGLLVLAFRGVDWAQLRAVWRHGQLSYLAAAVLTMSVSMALRGVRWRILLTAAQPITRGLVIQATAIGYLGNSFLPARAGEVIRSAIVSRRTGLGLSYVLATALTERLVDALTLVSICLLSLRGVHATPGWLHGATRITAVLGVAGLACLVVLPLLSSRLPWKAAPGSWLGAGAVLNGFLLGMRALQHPSRAGSFLSLTALIWLIDAMVALEVAVAFHLSFSLLQALFLLATLGLASAAPSTPGYVGIYQLVAVTIVPSFGATRAAALAYILAYQAVTYVVVTIWGLISLWRLSATAYPLLGSTSPGTA